MRSLLRKLFWGSLGVALGALSVFFAVMVIFTGPGAIAEAALFVLQVAAFFLTVPLLAATLLMFPAPSVSRRSAVRSLRGNLERMPGPARADLLLPLTRD